MALNEGLPQGPLDVAERLEQAKAEFHKTLIADSLMSDVLENMMAEWLGEHIPLAELTSEPTVKRLEGSRSKLGILATHSVDSPTDYPGFRAAVARVKAFELGDLHRRELMFWPSADLQVALLDTGHSFQESAEVARVWQRSTGDLISAFTGNIGLSPITHTFEIRDDVGPNTDRQ